jgi:signal transduction histidine kinase
MSHELRTPLNSILGFSDLLLSGTSSQLDERQKRYVTHISSGGRQLLHLVNEVLDLSKIRAGVLELFIESVSVAPLVDQCVAQIRPMAEAKQLVLGVDVEPELAPAADAHRLQQVLLNLLSNAVKFTPEHGSIWVRCWQIKGHVVIAVTDTGIGIPRRDQRRVFERFYRVDRARSRETGGTGLGLSIVKHIAENHGGSVSVQSELGQGSTFTVRLPAAPQAAARPSRPAPVSSSR